MHALLDRDGVFLCFDEAASRFCRAVPGEVRGDRSLVYLDDSAALVCDRDGRRLVPDGAAPLVEHVARPDDGDDAKARAVSLHLGAPGEDGETFELVERRVADDLVSFCRDRWVVVATRAMLDFRQSAVTGRHIASGDYRIDIDAAFPFVDAKRHESVAVDIAIVHDGWKVDRLRRYRPAAVMVQFSDNDLSKRMIKVLTTSLVEVGEFDGDLLVIGDQDRECLEAIVHPALKDGLMVEHREANGGLQYCLARWCMAEVEALVGYQPILYVDTDVVCDASLTSTLIELTCAERISAQVEYFNRASEAESCGSMLFAKDPMPLEGEHGICSGLVGLPNLYALGGAGRLIEVAASAYLKEHGPHSLLWNDQPVFNYVVRKLCIFEEGVVGRAVAIPQFADEVVLAERRGFVHFWRAGNSKQRADEMERYLRRLVEAKAAGQLSALHGN